MLATFQKKLRKNQTPLEQLLWSHLRNRRLHGFKFRRQVTLQGYIADPVCLEGKLIIEIDGSQHALQTTYDNLRTAKLKKDSFNIIKF